MSIYTNPADGAADEAAGYITALLELLGDRDAWDVLTSTVSECERELAKLDPEQRLLPEAEGKWSTAGVVQHLADSELVWAYRIRKVLAEDRPRLEGYDQDRWADRLGYATVDPTEALAMYSALRGSNLALLRRATPEDLQRVSFHDERGEESLAHMMRLYAGHDLVHLNQLRRVAAGAGPAGA